MTATPTTAAANPVSRYDRLVTRARLGAQEVSLRALALTGDPVARWVLGSPRTDVYALYERMRARGPVVRSRIGVLALTSAELCEQVLRDPNFGVRPAGEHPRTPMARMPMPPTVSGSFLEMDPPDHTRLRRAVAPAFRPRAVRSWAPRVEAVLHRMIDDLERSGRLRGGFDVMTDLAAPFPIAVTSSVLGIPDVDAVRFREIGAIVGQALDGVRTMAQADRLRAAGLELQDMFTRILDGRATDPCDDVLSVLAAARAEGAVTVDDALDTAGLLLVAGFETTVNLIGNGIAALHAHPDRGPSSSRTRTSPRPSSRKPSVGTRRSRPRAGSRTPTPNSPAHPCPPASPSSCSPPPPTATAPPFRTRGDSTCTAPANPITSPSPPASTTASARRWPASKATSPSAPWPSRLPRLRLLPGAHRRAGATIRGYASLLLPPDPIPPSSAPRRPRTPLDLPAAGPAVHASREEGCCRSCQVDEVPVDELL